MTIFIDNRAGSKKLHKLISNSELVSDFDSIGVPGDIYFEGKGPDNAVLVGVEVKTLSDFIGSVQSGRLFGVGGQIPRMLKYFGPGKIYLLVYGIWRARKDDSIEYWYEPPKRKVQRKPYWKKLSFGDSKQTFNMKALIKTLIECQQLGCHYLQARDINETARAIEYIYSWWSTLWPMHQLTHTFNLARNSPSLLPKEADDERLMRCARIASQFDGVQFKRGIAIAKFFDSDPVLIDLVLKLCPITHFSVLSFHQYVEKYLLHLRPKL